MRKLRKVDVPEIFDLYNISSELMIDVLNRLVIQIMNAEISQERAITKINRKKDYVQNFKEEKIQDKKSGWRTNIWETIRVYDN